MPQLSAHLRQALVEAGARIVHEGPATRVTREDLAGNGADVVVINLDAKVEEHLDALYDIFDEDRQRIVFNDAEASSGLSGWDQARWARHLAAKLMDGLDVDPPRPAEARPIEAHPTEMLLPGREMPEAPPAEETEAGPPEAPADAGRCDAPERGFDRRARGPAGRRRRPAGPMDDERGLGWPRGRGRHPLSTKDDIAGADLDAIHAIPDAAQSAAEPSDRSPAEPEGGDEASDIGVEFDAGSRTRSAPMIPGGRDDVEDALRHVRPGPGRTPNSPDAVVRPAELGDPVETVAEQEARRTVRSRRTRPQRSMSSWLSRIRRIRTRSRGPFRSCRSDRSA